jgi:ABC-2 type transport system permease protein
MSDSAARITAVVRKELDEFRRNRFIVATMVVLPFLFLASPTTAILTSKAAAGSHRLDNQVGLGLLFLTLIPVFVPATVAANSVVGEREQGTLEPLLTTPVRREELLIGKALANLVPAVVLSYLVFGVFLAIVGLGADPVIASAVYHAPQLLAEVFFIPLLACWAVWVGIAVSTKANDTRVAQQLSTLGSLPPIAVIALMSFHVIRPTFATALAFALVLLAVDIAAYRVVAALFDRERLTTGTRPSAGPGTGPSAGPSGGSGTDPLATSGSEPLAGSGASG